MSTLKKSAHTLTSEELLQSIEEDSSTIEGTVAFRNDVLLFISTFGIEPGTDKIKQHTLFTIYKAWSKEAIKKTEFLSEMRNFLEVTKINNSAAFLANQSAIKLTHDAYKHYSNENVRIKSKTWASHYENFLRFHSLSPGKYWIHGEILYFIYDKYTHATGLDRNSMTYMGKDTFDVYCKLYLERKLTKHGKYYAVSDNIQQFFQIGQLERMNAEYSKEKTQKKPSKRPRKKK